MVQFAHVSVMDVLVCPEVQGPGSPRQSWVRRLAGRRGPSYMPRRWQCQLSSSPERHIQALGTLADLTL